MNDLARPALYGAYHAIKPVIVTNAPEIIADVVGPICESGDFFAKDREIPSVEKGELLAIMSAGAYGFSMSSNYNSRPRAAEVIVKGNKFFTVRKRETLQDVVKGELLPKGAFQERQVKGRFFDAIEIHQDARPRKRLHSS